MSTDRIEKQVVLRAPMDQVSAWTGIHYFACRDDDKDRVFTWPEGNGWFVKQLMARVGAHVRTAEPVVRIRRTGPRVEVLTEKATYVADAVIFAAPTFLAPYLIDGMPPLEDLDVGHIPHRKAAYARRPQQLHVLSRVDSYALDAAFQAPCEDAPQPAHAVVGGLGTVGTTVP